MSQCLLLPCIKRKLFKAYMLAEFIGYIFCSHDEAKQRVQPSPSFLPLVVTRKSAYTVHTKGVAALEGLVS